MDETIARLNIEHFRKRLAEETDEAKRQAISDMMAEEEAKLQAILAKRKAGGDCG